MRRTNWDRARPAMNHAPVEAGIWGYRRGPEPEELDKPEEWFWLCPSCGELLRYTEHPAYPLHCGVRCRILHHMELAYVISEADSRARMLAKAQAVEARAYETWTAARDYYQELLDRPPRRIRWSPFSRDVPLKEKRRITGEHKARHQAELAYAWKVMERAAQDCRTAAVHVDEFRSD